MKSRIVAHEIELLDERQVEPDEIEVSIDSPGVLLLRVTDSDSGETAAAFLDEVDVELLIDALNELVGVSHESGE